MFVSFLEIQKESNENSINPYATLNSIFNNYNPNY